MYAVLFLPSVPDGGNAGGVITFQASREIMRTAGYSLPAFTLIWYLLDLKGDAGPITRKPRTGDFLSLAAALAGLLGIGWGISLMAPLFSDMYTSLTVESPKGAFSWLVMFLSCLGTGYLEETFFRHYLTARFREGGFPPALRIALPALLFAVCHLYEGFWGTLNALCAGLLLALVYARYGALHGLAWAHGCYNALVYTAGV